MVIEDSILINANIDKVWKTFSDITCWRDWNTVMRDIFSDERCLTPGGKITCCFRPFLFPINVRIEVKDVIPFERVVWSAEKKGFSAQHEFSFQNHKGGVLVTSRETFTGLLVRVLGFLLPKKRMQILVATFLKDLKSGLEN